MKTFFVPNWTSEEGQAYRILKYQELIETILIFLKRSNEVKIPFQYKEVGELEYPEFIHIQGTVNLAFDKLQENREQIRQQFSEKQPSK